MQKTWGQKKSLAEIVSLLKLIPAQKSLFELLANKQSQWITITSVSPELCKVLPKLGRQQVPAPIHPACCTDEHTQHTLSGSYRSAWPGHGGIWALSAHSVLFVSGHSKNQNSLKRYFSWTKKVLFCPAMAVGPCSWSFLYLEGYHLQSTIHEKGFSSGKEGQTPGPAWALGQRNSKVLQAVWPHSPA